MSLPHGIHDIAAAEYHSDPCETPSLSASVAKILVEKSPLHAWCAHPRLNPNYKPEESETFDYGTAAHAMLLEGRRSGLRVVEADDWRTKGAREQREIARAEGKTPILARQLSNVERMVLAAKAKVHQSELAGIFEQGKPEQTLIWREGKVWCRARLDWLTHKFVVDTLDYKTTQNAEPGAFCRSLWGLGYDVQEAFYRRGLRALGRPDPRFVFLAQEVEPPFACSLISLDPQSQAIGDAKVEEAIRLWGRCLEADKWPGYPTQIAYSDAPAYQTARWLEAA